MFKLFLNAKLLFLGLIYSFLVLEIILQLCLLFNFNLLKNPIIFYNPYCDQNYWLTEDRNNNIKFDGYSYHPLLTLINENTIVPSEEKNNSNKSSEFSESSESSDVIIYGSSFTGHKFFKERINLSNSSINYAVPSYGLDQIYLSYKLTKNKYSNKDIIIGFLLEDLDRSLFYKRDYEKMKFIEVKDGFEISNTPIDLKKERQLFDIYSLKLFKNILMLIKNNFSPKNSECFYEYKKDLFYFMLDDIISDSKLLNQNLIFITFNFIDDFNQDNVNWREGLVSDYFSSRNLNYINSKKIISEEIILNKTSAENYFNSNDMHLNAVGFDLVIKNLQSDISKR